MFSIALGGILPFGAVCIELFFIMSAMWLHQVCVCVSSTISLIYCFLYTYITDLLRLRVSVCGADHLGGDVCGDHHRHVLLPALQRGLPLVVALLPLCWVLRFVMLSIALCLYVCIHNRSSGLYLFLYSMWYFVSKLNITGLVPTVLYFAYMAMISLTFFVLTGSIGFFACLWFVRRIYGAIKVD